MRFLADENFDNRILAGLRRRQATLDIIRVQDTDLLGADDPAVLAWAAAEDRILLTHDAATIPYFAYQRIEAGEAMPGVIEVPYHLPIGSMIEELLLVIEASRPEDWDNQVVYLPLCRSFLRQKYGVVPRSRALPARASPCTLTSPSPPVHSAP